MPAPQKDISGWATYHQAKASNHEAFARLPRPEREAAYRAVRARVGSKTVSVDEMLHEYEKMKGMN